MPRLTFFVLAGLLLIAPVAPAAMGADSKDIGSVTVLTDQRLALSITELASLFPRKNMITVAGTFGVPENQEKRIEDGEAADLFITSNGELIRQLRIKGMVDVHSITHLASASKEVHYMAAVVAGENMNPARAFLAYLKSDDAKAVFRKNGLSVP